MAAQKPRRVLEYNLSTLPPRVFWKIPLVFNRADAASLCEQLYAITSEQTGASFYYPDLAADRTKCRYEWHRKKKGDRFAIRLGIILDVGSDGLSEIEAYATTTEAFGSVPQISPTFTQLEVTEFQEEVIRILQEAARRAEPQAARSHHIVYHIEMPYFGGLDRTLHMSDGRLSIFPTKIMREGNKRVSAVAFTVYSPSKELAKGAALKEISLFCALASLASDQLYQRALPKWPKRHAAPMHLASLENVVVDRLYPPQRTYAQLETIDPIIERRLIWIWQTYYDLPEQTRESILPALFAYYGGKTVQGQQATLATVAYVAALSDLATDKILRCAGEVSCKLCGKLPNFQHNIVGDRAAITQLILETLELMDPNKKKDVKDLLGRIYTKHRSAFVHGAELRHEEFHQGKGIPQHLPTADGPVREIAIFTEDLHSLALITRRTLLEWMSRKINRKLDYLLVGLDPEKVIIRVPYSGSIALPKNVLVGLQINPSVPDNKSS